MDSTRSTINDDSLGSNNSTSLSDNLLQSINGSKSNGNDATFSSNGSKKVNRSLFNETNDEFNETGDEMVVISELFV